MKRWYVIRTQPNGEDKASFHLRAQGFDVFLPKRRKQRRHARKTETVLRALFPGYLFVNIDVEAQQWRSINGTVGVKNIFCHGDKPMAVPIGVIEEIQSREIDGAVSLAPKGLKKGDMVRVIDGAFADCSALLEELTDEKRAILLLDLLGREVRVSAPLENLAIAS